MEVFVLLGNISYEGSYLMGVYHTQVDAENAAEEHGSGENGESAYDGYVIERRVIGARAKSNFGQFDVEG